MPNKDTLVNLLEFERPKNEDTTALLALAPHDGRYKKTTSTLSDFCSEAGLQRFRTLVEIEYLIHLNELENDLVVLLRNIYCRFDIEDAKRIKEIEKITNHDVKSVEYFINEKLDQLSLYSLKSQVHKFLTSEDVTNAAIALMVYASNLILEDEIKRTYYQICDLAKKWSGVSMLAHTHGQAASPTTVGKEFIIFANRINQVLESLQKIEIKVKWNGASGNYNAHKAAQPKRDWIAYSLDFIENHLGFSAELYTAQTIPYIYLGDILDQYKRLCSILIDLARDMWTLISFDYFKLKKKEGEVGSSVMPHKVNPIDFENAEGNLEAAESFCNFLACKLQKSRLQRDLSDSTVLRNLGLNFGWILIGLKSLQRGLAKLEINRRKINKDLAENPEVISEAIQTVMREEGLEGGYEQLKELTRGEEVNLLNIHDFIRKSELPEEKKQVLLSLLPGDYTGEAKRLVQHYLDRHTTE